MLDGLALGPWLNSSDKYSSSQEEKTNKEANRIIEIAKYFFIIEN